MLQAMTEFEKLWALGYTRLVPIIPPDARIGETSSLYKRIGTRQDARGKTPGTLGRNGCWYGFDWVPYKAEPEDLTRWAGMGAGVGIKTGHGLHAIDADTLDENCARIIRDAVQTHFGKTPIRVGQYPKALYLIRVDGDLPYTRVEFGTPDAHGVKERVEVLGERKQFVAHGIHKKTGKPYAWPGQLIPFDDLTPHAPEAVMAFMQALRSALPEADKPITEGAGTDVSQEALRGDTEAVRRAVMATPNTSEHFPSRESYRDMGYAIKAAIPDDPTEAFNIFADWCARWTDGDNDPDVIAADWRRMKPPYRRGASWLYEQAERLSNGLFTQAQIHFDPIQETAPSPFDVQAEAERQEQAADLYPLLTAEDLIAREPPTFLIDRHIPDVSVGFIYSDPGVGKSFVALDMALCIANGFTDWHGDKINAAEDKREVIYIASEGSFDLRNRLLAWKQERGVAQLSRRFKVIERTIDFMQNEDVAKLVRTVRAAAASPAIVFVDTVSRAMPGADENLQKDMTIFVKGCDAVRDAFGCAVVGVHHAGKSGDMRGSTVLRGAGDFVIKLERKRGAAVATLTMEKQKAAPDGWAYQIVFGRVDLGAGQTSLCMSRMEGAPGGEISEASADAVLSAMAAAWDAGKPWAMAPQTRERYAVRRMVADFGYRGDDAEQVLKAWEAAGVIRMAVCDARTKLKGLRVDRAGVDTYGNDGGTGETYGVFG